MKAHWSLRLEEFFFLLQVFSFSSFLIGLFIGLQTKRLSVIHTSLQKWTQLCNYSYGKE
jgi:hypothetical protein